MAIKPEHRAEAEAIGADSWELQRFMQLPRNASAARQVDALNHGQQWLRNHTEEICSRIDRLIRDIEGY